MRIATHGEFENAVLNANALLVGQIDAKGEPLAGKLEFFDAGGDARSLMSYMIKSEHCSPRPKDRLGDSCPDPGLLPGVSSVVNGETDMKRQMTAEYMKGFYHATFFPDRKNGPFAADAIISNPAAIAHLHIAQAHGIPLHMTHGTLPTAHVAQSGESVSSADYQSCRPPRRRLSSTPWSQSKTPTRRSG